MEWTPSTHLGAVHNRDARGGPIDQSLHFSPLSRSRPRDRTRGHECVVQREHAVVEGVTHCGNRHTKVKGNKTKRERPLITSSEQHQRQKDDLNRRAHPSTRTARLVVFRGLVQPRIHRQLETPTRELPDCVKLLPSKAAQRLQQLQVVVCTYGAILPTTPHANVGPPCANDGSVAAGPVVSRGRGNNLSDGGGGVSER